MSLFQKTPSGETVSSSVVLALGIAAVSTASIFIRYAQSGAPSLAIATYRLAIASLVLVPLAWRAHRAETRILRRLDWFLAILSGVFLALHFGTWITSLEYTSVASSVVLVTTSPLWVAVAAWIFLRERLTRRAIAGLIVAVVGGLIIGLTDALQGQGSAPLIGNALALAGALMVAGYWLLGRRLRGKLPLVPYIAIVYGIATVLLLIMTLVARQPLIGYEPTVYTWLLLLGLVPQLIGHSSFNWALGRLPATFVAVATLGEPVGSTVLAYLLLDESPTLLKTSGATLVLAGIVMTLLSRVAISATPKTAVVSERASDVA